MFCKFSEIVLKSLKQVSRLQFLMICWAPKFVLIFFFSEIIWVISVVQSFENLGSSFTRYFKCKIMHFISKCTEKKYNNQFNLIYKN